MKYARPQMIVMDGLAEGVFLASGCSYGTATVTFEEEDYRSNQYRITIKAPHQGKTNDGKGQRIVLNFSLPVKEVSSKTATVQGANSGTQVILTAEKSHHSEYNLEVSFQADSKPNVSALVTPAE